MLAQVINFRYAPVGDLYYKASTCILQEYYHPVFVFITNFGHVVGSFPVIAFLLDSSIQPFKQAFHHPMPEAAQTLDVVHDSIVMVRSSFSFPSAAFFLPRFPDDGIISPVSAYQCQKWRTAFMEQFSMCQFSKSLIFKGCHNQQTAFLY
jgi:hypothetical protein